MSLGTCGNCNSKNLNWKRARIEDWIVKQSFVCFDCGKSGEERYALAYVGTEMDENSVTSPAN